MPTRTFLPMFVLFLSLFAGYLFAVPLEPWQPGVNLSHQRHQFHRGERFETEKPSETRFLTSRRSEVALPLPKRNEQFSFVLFGDRTSGDDVGVNILADAVHDVNLLEPDFVINIGDMIQGNEAETWIPQMQEYKSIMDELKCPWFPVPGNHDVRWISSGAPPDRHQGTYEKHFGPIWYALEHAGTWFIVLDSEEVDRNAGWEATGEPPMRIMSGNQFAWLKETLARTKNADHVFVFMHKPLWQNPGGDAWNRVHRLLVDAGNVRAVFGGHIHTVTYEVRDKIEYATLSTTGGRHAKNGLRRIGFQDCLWLATVRKDRWSLAAIPVATMVDQRAVTTELSAGLRKLNGASHKFDTVVPIHANGAAAGRTTLTVQNVASVPIDLSARLVSDDSRWETNPYPTRTRLLPEEKAELEFVLKRPADSFDKAFRLPFVKLDIVALDEGTAVPLAERKLAVPLEMKDVMEKNRIEAQAVLTLSGREDRLVLPSLTDLEDGKPVTLETWFQTQSVEGLQALFSKGRDSNLALLLVDGKPVFRFPSGKRIVEVSAESHAARPDRWHHVAGVFDGQEIRLYFDGKLVARGPSQPPVWNTFALLVGAAEDRDNTVFAALNGSMDSCRLSTTARYDADAFEPRRDFESDPNTLMLLDMQESVGKSVLMRGTKPALGTIEGNAVIETLPE